jgi:Matrixin
VPGITLGPATSGTHATASVILNSRFTWNTSGTMNQAQRRTDVRTVSLHEIGHANGLHHPSACGAMTAAEVASAMNPNWTNKPNTNSDDKAGIAAAY